MKKTNKRIVGLAVVYAISLVLAVAILSRGLGNEEMLLVLFIGFLLPLAGWQSIQQDGTIVRRGDFNDFPMDGVGSHARCSFDPVGNSICDTRRNINGLPMVGGVDTMGNPYGTT